MQNIKERFDLMSRCQSSGDGKAPAVPPLCPLILPLVLRLNHCRVMKDKNPNDSEPRQFTTCTQTKKTGQGIQKRGYYLKPQRSVFVWISGVRVSTWHKAQDGTSSLPGL